MKFIVDVQLPPGLARSLADRFGVDATHVRELGLGESADRKWLEQLVSRRERPGDFARALQRSDNDIKVVVQFSNA